MNRCLRLKWQKAFSLAGLVLLSLLLCYFGYKESTVWLRASAVATTETPVYVHERYQRSYFSARDAGELHRLHGREVVTILGIVASYVAFRYSCNQRTA